MLNIKNIYTLLFICVTHLSCLSSNRYKMRPEDAKNLKYTKDDCRSTRSDFEEGADFEDDGRICDDRDDMFERDVGHMGVIPFLPFDRCAAVIELQADSGEVHGQLRDVVHQRKREADALNEEHNAVPLLRRGKDEKS
jgi:hypothetical protein